MTLAIELPSTLSEEFRLRQIPEKEIKAVVVAALEIWMAQQPADKSARFTESAAPFVQRLIAQNRELFENLVKQ